MIPGGESSFTFFLPCSTGAPGAATAALQSPAGRKVREKPQHMLPVLPVLANMWKLIRSLKIRSDTVTLYFPHDTNWKIMRASKPLKDKLNLSVATAPFLPHAHDWATMLISADSGLGERQDTNQPSVMRSAYTLVSLSACISSAHNNVLL